MSDTLQISSPLSPSQLEILSKILPNILPSTASHREHESVAQFCTACERAILHEITLHVRLPPPGHTDFGCDTTFPHCPRCKCASGERWKEPYAATPTACQACGHTYVPADTASSEWDEDDRNALDRLLSPKDYQAFRAAWLRRHAADVPTRLELLVNGKTDGTVEWLKEADAHGKRPSLLSRLWWRLAR